MPKGEQFKKNASPVGLRSTMQEKMKGIRGESMSLGWTVKETEKWKSPALKGVLRILIQDKVNGDQELVLPNIIVKTASILLASLLKDPSGLSGIQYLAVGTGAPEWNPMSPPPATEDQTQMENEVVRKAFTVCVFIDGEGAVSEVPTNVIDVTTTFEEGELAGVPLVEMGMVGGNATAEAYSGYLINYRTFKVINVPATARITFIWRFSF